MPPRRQPARRQWEYSVPLNTRDEEIKMPSDSNLVETELSYPRLKPPVFRAERKDLKYLRDDFKFHKRFMDNMDNLHRGVTIEVVQMEDAWYKTIMHIAEHGTCGKYVKGSYHWILYIWMCYIQVQSKETTKRWLDRKEKKGQDISDHVVHREGDYRERFLNWFAIQVRSTELAVKIQLEDTLFPKHLLGPDRSLRMYAGGGADKAMRLNGELSSVDDEEEEEEEKDEDIDMISGPQEASNLPVDTDMVSEPQEEASNLRVDTETLTGLVDAFMNAQLDE